MTIPRTPEQQKRIDSLMKLAFLLVVIALVFIGFFALSAASVIDRMWMGPAAAGAAVLMVVAIVLVVRVVRSAGRTAPPAKLPE